MPREIANQRVVPRLEDQVQRPRLTRGHARDLTDVATLVRFLALEQVTRRLCRLEDNELVLDGADVRDNEPDFALRCTLRPREYAELVHLDGHERLRGHGLASRDGARDGYDCDGRDPKCELSHWINSLRRVGCGAAWRIEHRAPSVIPRTRLWQCAAECPQAPLPRR